MKKKIFALALIALCAAVTAAGTLAYYTDSATAHNVITSGGIDIEIVETMSNGETFVDQTGVMPATAVSKIVKVHNDQDEAWIRVQLITSVESAGGASELDSKYVIPRFVNDDNAIALEDIKTMDTSFFKWMYKDGYWYYTEPVAKDADTDVLFHEVYFAKEMPNEYQNCTVKINVVAEAVQTAHNGETWDTVVSWTEE